MCKKEINLIIMNQIEIGLIISSMIIFWLIFFGLLSGCNIQKYLITISKNDKKINDAIFKLFKSKKLKKIVNLTGDIDLKCKKLERYFYDYNFEYKNFISDNIDNLNKLLIEKTPLVITKTQYDELIVSNIKHLIHKKIFIAEPITQITKCRYFPYEKKSYKNYIFKYISKI